MPTGFKVTGIAEPVTLLLCLLGAGFAGASGDCNKRTSESKLTCLGHVLSIPKTITTIIVWRYFFRRDDLRANMPSLWPMLTGEGHIAWAKQPVLLATT